MFNFRFIYLIVFGVISYGSSIAQIALESNAVWHYNYADNGLNSTFGFLKVESINQEVISSQLCYTLQTTEYSFQYDSQGNTELIGSAILDTNYIYSSGDTVFYYQNNEFRTLFNFGASIGDSWLVHVSENQSGCNDSSYAQVGDTGIMEINGVNYRYLHLFTDGLDQEVAMNGIYVERFGGYNLILGEPNAFLFPTKKCNINNPREFYFTCFEDNGLSLLNGDCEYYLNTLGIEVLDDGFRIYPNPFTEYPILNYPNGTHFSLFNCMGKLLINTHDPIHFQQYCSQLNSGVFILLINNKAKKRIIKYN